MINHKHSDNKANNSNNHDNNDSSNITKYNSNDDTSNHTSSNGSEVGIRRLETLIELKFLDSSSSSLSSY